MGDRFDEILHAVDFSTIAYKLTRMERTGDTRAVLQRYSTPRPTRTTSGSSSTMPASGDTSVRIVEQLTERNGLIMSSRFVTDHAAFTALMDP